MAQEWRTELQGFFQRQGKSRVEKEMVEVEAFMRDVGVPALQELKTELEKYGRTVTLRSSPSAAQATVQFNGSDEFTYRLQYRSLPEQLVPYAEIIAKERKGVRLIRLESMFRSDSKYTIRDIGKDDVIRHFMQHFTSRVGQE